jgi:hypothetical protein
MSAVTPEEIQGLDLYLLTAPKIKYFSSESVFLETDMLTYSNDM